jgi:hypothetical protein
MVLEWKQKGRMLNFFSYKFILTGILHQALLILKFLLMIYYWSVWNYDTLENCVKQMRDTSKWHQIQNSFEWSGHHTSCKPWQTDTL